MFAIGFILVYLAYLMTVQYYTLVQWIYKRRKISAAYAKSAAEGCKWIL